MVSVLVIVSGEQDADTVGAVTVVTGAGVDDAGVAVPPLRRALVRGPRYPTGVRPFALWKAATAVSVTVPK
jgi:hypothetical protein